MDQLSQLSKTKQRGQFLIELLVAMGVVAILIPALVAGFVATRSGKAQAEQRLEATALAREAAEAVRVVRESGWSNVGVTGTFHPVLSGFTWALAPGAETINGYSRSITFDNVYRDSEGAIVETGGTLDPSTKLVTVSVSWGTPIASSVMNTMYITRLENIAWTQTTQVDFDLGTMTNTISTNTDGGEITLSAGGSGRADWCSPNLSIAATDLPKQGVANAISAIEGRIFAGTGENASGVSYATVFVDNLNPPSATVSGTFDGYKTNDIFGEAGFAYIATDNNAKEIEIVNLSTSPYTEAGYFNAPGNGNGDSVYVSGNVGYMTSGNTFYTFDLASKFGSRSYLGSVVLAGTGTKMSVVGNYAYVAISSSTTQLQIIDISNASSPTIVGSVQINGEAAVDVYINQTATRAYIATALSATKSEMFIIDITTKTGAHTNAIGSYDSSGMNPQGVTVVTGNRLILVGTGGIEYQAISILNESSPSRCGELNVDTGVRGVASVFEADGDAYSYIITGDATSELKIIEGGPGGKFNSSGTFVSTILDATTSSAFNRFIVNANLPIGTTAEYQVSAADAVDDSCTAALFTFVGPDGTGGTKYATGGAIPFSTGPGYKNPARCFQYKVFLSTIDLTAAPVVTDMTINYSP